MDIYQRQLTTFISVKGMEIYFPFLLFVHHVNQKFLIAQTSILILVITGHDSLNERIILRLLTRMLSRRMNTFGYISTNVTVAYVIPHKELSYLNLFTNWFHTYPSHFTLQLLCRYKPVFILVEFIKQAAEVIHDYYCQATQCKREREKKSYLMITGNSFKQAKSISLICGELLYFHLLYSDNAESSLAREWSTMRSS